MEFLYEYGLFFAKTITFVLAVIAIIVASVAAAGKGKAEKGELKFTNISEQLATLKDEAQHQLLSKQELKVK